MLAKILDKIKNRSFWAGVATTIAGVLGGAMTAPEAILNLLTSLIGG